MLTFAQVATVAFTDDSCEFFCPPCAAEKFGSLQIAKVEAGFLNGEHIGVRKVSDYEMGEAESQEAWSYAEAMHENEGEDRSVDEIAESLEDEPIIHCSGSCGRCYTGGAEPWQKPNPVDGSKPEYVRSTDDDRWLF